MKTTTMSKYVATSSKILNEAEAESEIWPTAVLIGHLGLTDRSTSAKRTLGSRKDRMRLGP